MLNLTHEPCARSPRAWRFAGSGGRLSRHGAHIWATRAGMGAVGRNRKPEISMCRRIVNTILIRVPLNTNRCVCTDRVSYYKRCPCTNTGASRFSQAASPLRHAPRHALPLHGVVHPPDPPAPSLSPPQMRNSSAKAAHASCQLPSRLRCIPGQKSKRTERICQARAALIDAGHRG